MKRSSMVALVISGALLTGCDSSNPSGGWEDSQSYTNNHYATGRGYYHAPYQAFYPFPYNYRDPARGYYHGGQYTAAPLVSSITESKPTVRYSSTSTSPHVRRSGFTSTRSFSS